MKEWFKYEYGFINIDEHNIFLTNTGNWSETRGLKEKGDQKVNRVRRIRFQVSIALLIIITLLLFYNKLFSDEANLFLIIGIPLSGYSLYNYLKSELGSKYKLPISKISNIEIDKQDVNIQFFNFKNELDNELLENIDTKSLGILTRLKDNIPNKK